MIRLARLARHFPAIVALTGLAVLCTWPLATHFTTYIPGPPGDNLAFLWNSWWMREALAADLELFHTDYLFAPVGIDLTLHTHTALSSWVSAVVFGRWPLVAAHNLTLTLTLALNGIAAYLLAWDRLRQRSSACVAGLIYAASPYLTAHLLGHVNLLSAWGLPLFTLLWLRTVERRSWRAAIGAGVVIVATAYNDYYYVIYCGAVAMAVLAAERVSVVWTPVAARPRLAAVLRGLIALDAALVIAVVASGGFTAVLWGIRIAANRPTNLLAVGWLLLAALWLTHRVPRLRRVGGGPRPRTAVHGPLMAMLAVIGVGLLPLLLGAWRLYRNGNFTSPPASWRSGPAGVDLATLLLGNPWHGWWGAAVRELYRGWQIDPIESVGWLGVMPVVLGAMALIKWRRDREVRIWRWVAGVSFVWALGPWLRVFGVDTGLLLPQNLLAHIPLLSNARMPGRAIVVVFMALSMLAAFVVSRVGAARRRWLVPAVIASTLLDFWPAPFPATRIESPAIFDTLRHLPPGTVCELPVGIRDGFGVHGAFDDRVLLHQMTHGHPIVGGFAARVPESVTREYARMPVVRSLFRLSGGESLDPADVTLTPAAAAAALQRATVSYLVLNRALASGALVEYVEQSIAQRVIASEGEFSLYAVEAGR